MNNEWRTILGSRIHMVGIGGVGMSGLAKFFRSKEIVVTGSDRADSLLVKELVKKFGIPVTVGTNPEIITEAYDALVYSPAIPDINEERMRAYALGIPQYTYPEALGIVTRDYTTITVSGTNGKTTTTTMVTELLDHLGMNPSAIIGERAQKFNTNYIEGDSPYFVVEACEYKDSFLNITFSIAVITNITEDHLDYFDDLEDIQDSFTTFINNGSDHGTLVCDTRLPALAPVIARAKERNLTVIDFSKFLDETLSVTLPGEHNKLNAAAALGVIEALGLPLTPAKEYLATSFKGAKRRFEFLGTTTNGALVYDDYAHNPEGLDYLVSSMRTLFPDKKLVLVFEPHLYSRTRDFKNEFLVHLKRFDECYFFPTYRAREPEQKEEDFLLADEMGDIIPVYKIRNEQEAQARLLTPKYGTDTVIVTAGAGIDVGSFGELLIKKTG